MQAFRTIESKFKYWAETVPFLNFIVIVLSWFAVTVETFLRRDFGERYFNQTKVMSGFFLLAFWTFISKIGSAVSNPMGSIFMPPELQPEQSSFPLKVSVFTLILALYVGFCGYHKFVIWWRNSTGRPLHSWDSGTSWLIPVGQILIIPANLILGLICRLYSFFLPSEEREEYSRLTPPAIDNYIIFTEKWVEPLTVFFFGLLCLAFHAFAVASWLLVSAFALVFFTALRLEKEREWFLDFQDNLINSEDQKSFFKGEWVIEKSRAIAKDEVKRQALQKMAAQAERMPEVVEQVREEAPSLADAMLALNPKLRNLSGGVKSEAEQSIP